MTRLVIFLLSLFAGACLSAPPQWPTWPQVQRDTEQFVYDRIGDGHRLILGPHAPHTAPVAPHQTCEALYAQRLALMQTQYDYKPAYTDDPRNRAAIFIGTIFTPAFYFLAFSGIQAYGEANDDAATHAQLDTLRYASAQQQCFVR
ncbi:MAG: hypothetical protein ACREXT_17430 [Gammaproteobacteria bacterium]